MDYSSLVTPIYTATEIKEVEGMGLWVHAGIYAGF